MPSDTERLDWLSLYADALLESPKAWIITTVRGRSTQGRSLREAIDSAMQAEADDAS